MKKIVLILSITVLTSCSDQSPVSDSKDIASRSPYSKCSTKEAVRDFMNPGLIRPKLISDGIVTADLNRRFCVHEVRDGSHNLVHGSDFTLGGFIAPLPVGALIAIADVGSHDGVTFDEAVVVCPHLTLLGKHWFLPATADNDRASKLPNIDSIDGYFAGDPEHIPGGFNYRSGSWYWSSSKMSLYAKAYYARDGIIDIRPKTTRMGVRCVVTP